MKVLLKFKHSFILLKPSLKKNYLPDVFAAKRLSSSSFIINGNNKHEVTRQAFTVSCNSFTIFIFSSLSLSLAY